MDDLNRREPCTVEGCLDQHCTGCNRHVGGQGHLSNWCKKRRESGELHLCCGPEECDFDRAMAGTSLYHNVLLEERA